MFLCKRKSNIFLFYFLEWTKSKSAFSFNPQKSFYEFLVVTHVTSRVITYHCQGQAVEIYVEHNILCSLYCPTTFHLLPRTIQIQIHSIDVDVWFLDIEIDIRITSKDLEMQSMMILWWVSVLIDTASILLTMEWNSQQAMQHQ